MDKDELAALDRAATQEVERLSRELDITNADHIALWLETNGYPHDGFLAVQIVEAYERAIRRKHVFWGAGEPDCPREIKAGNGELHTLRCKVCGEDSPRLDMPCRGATAVLAALGVK